MERIKGRNNEKSLDAISSHSGNRSGIFQLCSSHRLDVLGILVMSRESFCKGDIMTPAEAWNYLKLTREEFWKLANFRSDFPKVFHGASAKSKRFSYDEIASFWAKTGGRKSQMLKGVEPK